MKILITGNMGYVGPLVVARLRHAYPDAELIGYDMAYFASCLTDALLFPESKLDRQIFGDVRTMPSGILKGIDVVVHLAAISNDPMGTRYEDVTIDVNYRSSVKIAKMAKEEGVSSFVFASSCSMYGAAEDRAKTESSELNPLTAYARSKVFTEADLGKMADDTFTITCLRFATACGMSPRLRLDLVLNDFVASATASGEISILSDGSPWRPLIHVKDMARAIEWAVTRKAENGGEFLAVNTGSNLWNFQVLELAEAVAKAIPGAKIKVNKDAPPDKRSYRVSFDLFKSLAPGHQPLYNLDMAIQELHTSLKKINFSNGDFRNSELIRLRALGALLDKNYLTEALAWNYSAQKEVSSEPGIEIL